MTEHPRTCIECERGIDEGYLFEPTGDTFCGIECAESDFPPIVIAEFIGEGILFWTHWRDERC